MLCPFPMLPSLAPFLRLYLCAHSLGCFVGCPPLDCVVAPIMLFCVPLSSASLVIHYAVIFSAIIMPLLIVQELITHLVTCRPDLCLLLIFIKRYGPVNDVDVIAPHTALSISWLHNVPCHRPPPSRAYDVMPPALSQYPME